MTALDAASKLKMNFNFNINRIRGGVGLGQRMGSRTDVICITWGKPAVKRRDRATSCSR